MRRPGSITTFMGAFLVIATFMIRGSGVTPSDGATTVPLADTTLTPRFHDGRPIIPVKSLRMRVTAYSPDHRSCGDQADGITASGYSVQTNGGRLVAADRRMFKFGELISIPGYAAEHVVPVLDRGGAIKGNRIDVLYPTHERAMQWGVKHLIVTVWAYADGRPIGFKRPR
jgi:3D (Asp-Asp-Asp) domain-containing protein